MKEENILKLVLVVVFILSVLPWMQSGFVYSDDYRCHLAHVWNMKNNLNNGDFPFTAPMLEIYSGWPIWEFYSLVPYVMTLPFVFIFGAVTALKASIVLSFAIAILSMFVACNLLFKNNRVSIVSSVAYTWFGYHFINAGSRGAFNELWGYSLFPLAIALFIKAINEPDKKNIIYAILGTAIIVLTHVPTAWMLGMVYIAYIVNVIWLKKAITKNMIKVCSLVLIGSILLTIFSIGPLYAESKKVNFEELGGTSIIGFDTPGVSLSQTLIRGFGNQSDGTRYFYIGFSLITLLFVAFFNIKEYKFYSYLFCLSFLAMTAPILIKFIPLASVLQFSFRLMVIIGFCLAIIAGLSSKHLADIKPEKSLWIIIGIILVIIIDFFGANSFAMTGQPNENFINPQAEVEVLHSISYDKEYFLVFAPFAQADYMYTGHYSFGFDWAGYRQGASAKIHKEYSDTANAFINDLRTNNKEDLYHQIVKLGYYGVKYITLPCGTPIENLIIPKYSSQSFNTAFCNYVNPYFSPLIIEESDKKIPFTIYANKIEFITSGNATKYLIKIFNYHWKATIQNNNQKQEIPIAEWSPEYMIVSVPDGDWTVKLIYESTMLQKITLAISLLSLIGLIYIRFKK